jgi:hypothetical protein
MHTDNIAAVDIAPMALLTIQYNLAAGTIAPWSEKRPELRPILQKILDFEVSCVVQHALSSMTDLVFKGPIHVDGASTWVRIHPLVSYSHWLIQITRLDAISMETRADMQDDGSFILNTPNDGAAKFVSR